MLYEVITTDLGVLTNADYFDYQDISIKNSVGYAVAMSSFKVVDRVENDSYNFV